MKLLEASENMLLAITLQNIPALNERKEEFEVAIIKEKERGIRSKIERYALELNDLGKRRMELCNRIDERKKERERIRGRNND